MKNPQLNIALEASLQAGKVIMEVYNSDINVDYKTDNSPITEADKKANTVITNILKNTGIPIISEENKQTDYNIRKTWETCWIIDPVDGTKEFIKRNGEFTVNIALVINGKPIIGVIYVPATQVLYFADVSTKKAFKSTLTSHSIPVSKVLEMAKPLTPKNQNTTTIQIVGSRSHISPETIDFIDNIKKQGKTVEIVSIGSSLKFCLIAEGCADIYPRFAPTMEWDTAAGHAICNAVGVNVIAQDSKTELVYNKKNLLNPWFLVSK